MENSCKVPMDIVHELIVTRRRSCRTPSAINSVRIESRFIAQDARKCTSHKLPRGLMEPTLALLLRTLSSLATPKMWCYLQRPISMNRLCTDSRLLVSEGLAISNLKRVESLIPMSVNSELRSSLTLVLFVLIALSKDHLSLRRPL